jgi:hypothetical protein
MGPTSVIHLLAFYARYSCVTENSRPESHPVARFPSPFCASTVTAASLDEESEESLDL